jgi:hypothetical protein
MNILQPEKELQVVQRQLLPLNLPRPRGFAISISSRLTMSHSVLQAVQASPGNPEKSLPQMTPSSTPSSASMGVRQSDTLASMLGTQRGLVEP